MPEQMGVVEVMNSEYIFPYQLPANFSQNAINLYTIDETALKDLQDYVWEQEPDFWNSLTGIIQNAMDCIVTIHAIPCAPELQNNTQRIIRVGNKGLSTTGNCKFIKRYAVLESDSFNFPEYYSTVLDYEPYTRVKLYLPYSGTYDIKTSDIMNLGGDLKCVIDMLTGDMVYTLMCGNADSGLKNLYHFSGNCKASIPLSSADYSRLFSGLIQGGMSTVGQALHGTLFSEISSATNTALSGIKNANSPNISYTNGVSADKGWLSTQTPYFIIERPVTHVASNYDEYIGYPSLITKTLSDLSGYTTIAVIHLDDISATDTEKKELETLLMNGVIL